MYAQYISSCVYPRVSCMCICVCHSLLMIRKVWDVYACSREECMGIEVVMVVVTVVVVVWYENQPDIRSPSVTK